MPNLVAKKAESLYTDVGEFQVNMSNRVSVLQEELQVGEGDGVTAPFPR